jgi:membrane-associated phospholipid phosphatase
MNSEIIWKMERIGKLLSLIFSHPVISAGVILIVSLYSKKPLETLTLGIAFISILPVIPIVYEWKKGKTDMFVEEREKRGKFFAISLFIFAACYLLSRVTNLELLSILSTCYFFVTLAVFLLNFKWKVSVHTAAVAGPSTFLTFFLNENFAFMYLLLIPTAAGRKMMNSHSFSELLAGAVVAFLITLLTLKLFFV